MNPSSHPVVRPASAAVRQVAAPSPVNPSSHQVVRPASADHLMDTSTDLPVPGIVDALNILPGATPERVSSFVLPTLSLHAHVPEKTRAKVWSGDFVDLATFLLETSLFQPNYALTIREPCLLRCTHFQNSNSFIPSVVKRFSDLHVRVFD